MDLIPADVQVRCYHSLRSITRDHLVPAALEKKVKVFWGVTGSGKSRLAWQEAGLTAYPKGATSKFWDGYRSHAHVVIDEFRGQIGISHMLTWLDRYPCIVEIKGSSVCLCATHIWICSNLHPKDWYPDIDQMTLDALLRRLEITEFHLL